MRTESGGLKGEEKTGTTSRIDPSHAPLRIRRGAI
jgi:hypothetical protein